MFKSTLCDTLWVVYKVAWTASLNLDGLGRVLGNNIDRLLTERKGSTGEYWPEVVAVLTVIKLTWRMFVFFIHLWNLGKISIFQGSSGSFTVKNDNIHSFFFSLFWLQILNLPASLQNENTRVGPFPWKRSVLQNPDPERTNQSTRICLRLGLPYNDC